MLLVAADCRDSWVRCRAWAAHHVIPIWPRHMEVL